MSNIKLQLNQIQIGQPLAFDAFDAEGKLLLRRGIMIDSVRQVEGLLERGLYREPGPEYARRNGLEPFELIAANTPRPVARKVSVFELVAQVQQQLDLLLSHPSASDFAARIKALAARLQHGFKLDGDAALATIQILHEGRYSIRRQIHGAILVELLLGHAGRTPEHRQKVMCAALTMNIAMLELQDALFDQAQPPSPEQRASVREHSEEGVHRLRALGVTDELWLRIVEQHHETIDGKGSPKGLSADQICKEAQVLSIADRYGALATGRGYRAAALPNVVLKQIFMDKDKGVDAGIASLLVKAVGVYPPGSLVELANGDIAVVVKRTQSASQPVVRCVKTYRKEILAQPRKRLTSEPAYAITKLIPISQLGFNVDPALLWDEGFEVDPL